MFPYIEQKDLDRLLTCPNEDRDIHKRGRAKQQAMRILIEILNRLPRPRAYLIEPTHAPNKQQNTHTWDIGMDILSAQLSTQGISVIDPASLRALVLFCPALHDHLESTDALWLSLVAVNVIEQVYIPDDGTGNKRHTAAHARAIARHIEVHTWCIDWECTLRPSHP